MIKNSLIFFLLVTLGAGGLMVNRVFEQMNQAMLLMQIKHKKDIARTKIKERSKRLLAVLPVAGAVAAVWFEKREYDEWKRENPEGTPEQYTDEVKSLATEISVQLYRELKTEYPWLSTTDPDKATSEPSL